MNLLAAPLVVAARHGRALLIAGLLAGVLLPDLAGAMKPWIGELVALMLFVAALRVGPRRAMGAVGELRASVGFAVLLQVALPLVAALLFVAAGFHGALALALVLMMSASPISGSPNLVILCGSDPAPALRQLVVGTALLPVTVLPVFWMMPDLGGVGTVALAAARLLAIIAGATVAAFAVRHFFWREPGPRGIELIDGASAILMAVVVVGLMSAVGPAIRGDPAALATALAAAFAGNFGLQLASALLLRRLGMPQYAVSIGIISGNRNIALFLAALPAAVTDPLLLFIGCYQIPMYLTPMLLGGFYRRMAAQGQAPRGRPADPA